MAEDEAAALAPIISELDAAVRESSAALDVESALRKSADSHSDAEIAEDLRRLAVAFGY